MIILISYYDYTNTNLKYAYYDGSSWHIETVDSYGDVGMFTSSIALDSNDHPHISYYDVSWGNLKYARMDKPPVIDSFTANPSVGLTPLSVTFTCNAHDEDGSIVRYEWDFDGDDHIDNTTTVNTVTHKYTTPGVYNARVTVVDNDGGKTTSKDIKIYVGEMKASKTVEDTNGGLTLPGDILEYSIWLNNTGSIDTIAKFVDPIPEHTTYVEDSAWASIGTAYYNSTNNSIEWNGTIPAGNKVNIKFRVKIDTPLPNGTIISNQGIVYYDSNNDSIMDAEKPTDDPTTDKENDPTNVTVKNPKITLTKTTIPCSYYDSYVNYTIKLCVEGYATNITLIEHYPSEVQFISSSIPPTKGNNIWYFEKLQDECVTITITTYLPFVKYEYSSQSAVKGKGLVIKNKMFSTEIKKHKLVNKVTLTCYQGVTASASATTEVMRRGIYAEINEHGIGNYSTDETIKVNAANDSIAVDKRVSSTNAAYNNIAGLAVKNVKSAGWTVKEYVRNKYNDYICRRLYGDIDDYANLTTLTLNSKTKINGSYSLKIKSDFRMNEKYSGNFEINERIDGDADIDVKGNGLGIFEEKATNHRMFERGMGNYESKTYFNELSFKKKTNATNFLQKVCYFNNGNYVSTTTEGNFSNNVKAYTLLNYSLNSQLNGSLKFKANVPLAKVNEWYAGRFSINKEISTAYLTPWIPDGIISKGEYENKTAFDGLEIYWKSDDEYIYIALKANTTGWLRIGFAMCSCFDANYDYVAGFVVNNKTKVLDMYYNGTLMMDEDACLECCKQSIDKFGGSEFKLNNSTYTIIEFKRKLDTKDACDAKLVKGDKVKIVWAVGKDDDVWSKAVRSGEGEIVV